MADCIFCGIASGEIETRIIFENDDIVAFKDLNPQAPTHILIIPKKHLTSLSDAKAQDLELLGKLQLAAVEIANKFGLKDFRLVTNNGKGAGQSVGHLHFHLLAGRRMLWPPG
ncbi:Histidine triad (HIT) protein [Elusimicrobium minutum Pei191]|uniref:Histidine triad (HIT) protein n=1 Tax=Elusimicrobium minutum (strain Pei191) TaxID=445932 RepID=B2KBX1_ELUMP|nr:histidine triad nucleotide-binding protein [Elusimicrobium minutum]ACC97875.1 Histidine triad (HIT) protein [Elusimicrobium minutum Pei191]